MNRKELAEQVRLEAITERASFDATGDESHRKQADFFDEVAAELELRTVVCAGCGEVFQGPGDEAMAATFAEHITACPKHPYAALTARLEATISREKKLREILVDIDPDTERSFMDALDVAKVLLKQRAGEVGRALHNHIEWVQLHLTALFSESGI